MTSKFISFRFLSVSSFTFSCLVVLFIFIFCMTRTLCCRLSFSQDRFLYLYSSIYSLLSLLSLCCGAKSGCSAKSNSPSYNSSHAISNNSGRAASSFFSSWICGEDGHISEVSWSAPSSFLSHSLSLFILNLSYFNHWTFGGWVNVVLWRRYISINFSWCRIPYKLLFRWEMLVVLIF